MNKLNKLKVLVLSIWVGGLFIVGALVAPVLFYKSGLSSADAGMIAGKCFDSQSILNLACAVIVLFGMLCDKQTNILKTVSFWLWLGMLICLLANQYGITPIIEQIKSITPLNAEGRYGAEFAKWHGISSILYWLQALLGIILLWIQIPNRSNRWNLFFR